MLALHKTLRFAILSIMSIGLTVTAVSTSSGASIGVNFVVNFYSEIGGEGSDGNLGELVGGDLAGAAGYAQQNWNNAVMIQAYTTQGPFSSLIDSAGNPVPLATVLVSAGQPGSGDLWFSTNTQGSGADDDANDRLMRNGIHMSQAGGPPMNTTHTVTVANIPYGNYDVVVYYNQSDSLNSTPTVDFSVDALTGDASYSASVATAYDDSGSTITTNNHHVFTGLTGNTLTITQFWPNVDPDGGFQAVGGLVGFQIVEAASAVPEPSTWALGLIGLAGLGVVVWRKRRK